MLNAYEQQLILDKPNVPKYILMPGYIISKHDGQEHYIKANDLARLYGVSMSECVIAPSKQEGWKPGMNMILLRPRSDGDYKIPKD